MANNGNIEQTKSENSDKLTPYKEVEFEAFLKTIKEGQAAHWKDIADALGVDPDTITSWKSTPEAQAAIRDGITHALACMQQAGARDWRMWESKLKMLGINPATNVDVKSDGKKIQAATIIDLGNLDAANKSKAEPSSPND